MKNVMILSGAGLSAPSGLRTFRDSNGLWEEYDVMEVCSATGFRKNPQKVLDFYDARRAQLQHVKPNKAHQIIAKLKKHYKENLFVVTQNVDDLLERAGCEEVIHLHGFLPELRCLECGEIFNINYESILGKICPRCKSKNLRHNIIMFEEQAPAYVTLYELLNRTNLFISIGTSGQVLPVGHYARMCEKSILNIMEKDEYLEQFFDKIYIENVLDAMDKIANDIKEFMDV
ncbi:SIR2 family NAD-dependent protein deacylase [Campylobacter cuniculorum]|uniref:NAD-dependent protein deacylase n=2 Tax=Campylobacter cuniculorum TaxID=374106 RepID=A0A1W6BZ21_9BACT|nr:NAD-dependent deacetylase [Campylobacter cuniculorum]ARJ57338.1 NAD-dependent protein deacetylase, SIR2 family [Campylobacter cuniculorum DSM 23162 = LMG 24588]QOR04773.1 NAD-dependent deacetylase [Campylobacter cuniculorum]